MLNYKIIEGDLIDQDVDVIVNAWNRNIIPWWLLFPQGVSKTIKRNAGYQPFIELSKIGSIKLGNAVWTNSGKLTKFKGLIHVAGINMFWMSSEYSIKQSIFNSLNLAIEKNCKSIAFPIIGSGSGNGNKTKCLNYIIEELNCIDDEKFNELTILIIKYKKNI